MHHIEAGSSLQWGSMEMRDDWWATTFRAKYCNALTHCAAAVVVDRPHGNRYDIVRNWQQKSTFFKYHYSSIQYCHLASAYWHNFTQAVKKGFKLKIICIGHYGRKLIRFTLPNRITTESFQTGSLLQFWIRPKFMMSSIHSGNIPLELSK